MGKAAVTRSLNKMQDEFIALSEKYQEVVLLLAASVYASGGTIRITHDVAHALDNNKPDSLRVHVIRHDDHIALKSDLCLMGDKTDDDESLDPGEDDGQHADGGEDAAGGGDGAGVEAADVRGPGGE